MLEKNQFGKFIDMCCWERCLLYFEQIHRIPKNWTRTIVAMRVIQRDVGVYDIASALFLSHTNTKKTLKDMALNGLITQTREADVNPIHPDYEGRKGYNGGVSAQYKLAHKGNSMCIKIDRFLNTRTGDIHRLEHFKPAANTKLKHSELQLKLMDIPI